MASPSQDSPLKTLYRLSVMVGVLACGSMTAYKYGPEAGELASMIDAAAERLGVDVPTDPAAAKPSMVESPMIEPQPLLMADASPIESSLPSDSPPRFDPAVLTASAQAAIPRAPANPIDPVDRERLIAPVLAAGVTQADVTLWSDGVYRAQGSMPVGDPASGLKRQFDAQGSTPELAVAELLRQVQTELYR